MYTHVHGCLCVCTHVLLKCETIPYKYITLFDKYLPVNIFHGPSFNILSQILRLVSLIPLKQVSSFDTVAERAGEKEKVFSLKVPKGCDENDFIRWRNSICRDFTINA